MCNVKTCKSGCSRVQCANVCSFALQYIVHYPILCLSCSMCFQLYPCICSRVLFPVWCSALVHKDCQSNALTPSICSMVTSSMDVMRWVAYVTCYVVTCIAVLSVFSVLSVYIHTVHVHGHRQVFCLHSTLILYYTLYTF